LVLSFLLLVAFLLAPVPAPAQSIEGLEVEDGGRVGVGTSVPIRLLDVGGASHAGDKTSIVGTHDIGASFEGTRHFGYFVGHSDNGRGFLLGKGDGATYVDLRLDRADALAITGGGVGIGTNDPKSTLDVRGTLSAEDLAVSEGMKVGGTFTAETFRVGGASHSDGKTSIVGTHDIGVSFEGGSHYGYFAGHNARGRGFYLGWGNGASYVDLHLDRADTLAITGGGVGIGTNTPESKLDVRGTLTAEALDVSEGVEIGGTFTAETFQVGGASHADGKTSIVGTHDIGASFEGGSHYGYFAGHNANGRGFYLGWGDGSSYVDLHLDRADTLAITGGGVGIGTDTPASKLDVRGTLTAEALDVSEGVEIGGTFTAETFQVGGASHSDGKTSIVGTHDIGASFEGGTHYGYFAGHNANGRGFYLGWGDGSSYVDLHLDQADTLAITGGGVGIGTDTPESKLDVRGTLTAEALDVSEGVEIGGTFTAETFRVGEASHADGKTSIVGTHDIGASFEGESHYGYFAGHNANGRGFYLGWGDGSSYVDLHLDQAQNLAITGGNLGVGTSSPSSALEVNGTVRARTVQETSARRFKTAIEPIDGATSLVEQLRGVRYRWKNSGAPDVGFVAEEVQEVLPSLVQMENGTSQSLNYTHLTAVLTEAFKEQADRAEARTRRLEAQAERLRRQKRELDRLARQNETLREKSRRQQKQIDTLRRQVRTLLKRTAGKGDRSERRGKAQGGSSGTPKN
jgi:cytoskeletal protein CcmA (bactofilin family)